MIMCCTFDQNHYVGTFETLVTFNIEKKKTWQEGVKIAGFDLHVHNTYLYLLIVESQDMQQIA